jgi:hypothetical protein
VQEKISLIDSQLSATLQTNSQSVGDMKGNVEVAEHLLSEAKQKTHEINKLLSSLQQQVADNEKVIRSLSDVKTIDSAVSKDAFKDAVASKVSTLLQPQMSEAILVLLEK